MTTLMEATIQPNLALVLVIAVLVGTGTILVLDRSLMRILLGLLLLGNGVSTLYIVAGGAAGDPPFVGADPTGMSDPLPQAMVLTAIVISLATLGFLLAMAYRLWQLSGADDVPDDAEDARILSRAAADQTSSTYDPSESPTSSSDEDAVEDPVAAMEDAS